MNIYIALVVAAVLSVAKASTSTDIQSPGNAYLPPTFIVSVEGKSFYADVSISRNWTMASQYCQENGMELASVTSAAQFDALNASYGFPDFSNFYWTSGRDALEPRQFSWNGTEEAVSAYVNYRPNASETFQSCLLFISIRPESYVGSFRCSLYYGALCES